MEPKKLFRSRTNKVIGGVAGGIGEYLNADPVVIRLFLVLFTLLGGAGLILYLVLLLVIPLKNNEIPSDTSHQNDHSSQTPFNNPKETFEEVKENLEDLKNTVDKSQTKSITTLVIGVLLMAWGSFILLKQYVFIRIEIFPLFLICFGFLLLILSFMYYKNKKS